jgi:hypothetical protein
MKSPGIQLARNWEKDKVLQCHDSRERQALVCFLRERYSERFFEPIDCLAHAAGSRKGFGFAIMSLCCLMIETIQCYRLGWPSSFPKDLSDWASLPENLAVPEPFYRLVGPFDRINYSSEIVFKSFFDEPKHQTYFSELKGKGDAFYRLIRCGLLHQAQTKGGWRIIMHGQLWDDTAGKTINRTEFSRRLDGCFEAFLQELETANWDEEVWKNARKKIWWLAKTS